jgi:hypothetical protein
LAVGEVGLAGAEVSLELQQQQQQQQGDDAAAGLAAAGLAAGLAAAAADGDEEALLADYSMLPEECWMDVLQRLGVKELCYMSRVSR